jgi:hypothetical protein
MAILLQHSARRWGVLCDLGSGGCHNEMLPGAWHLADVVLVKHHTAQYTWTVP